MGHTTLTFCHLNVDIIRLILQEVHDTSRSTIFSLLRVNQALHEITRPFAYQDCTLHFGYPNHQQIKDILISLHSPQAKEVLVCSSIQRLRLAGRWSDISEPIQELLFSLIPHVNALKDIIIFQSVPLSLLDILEKYHPTVRLHLLKWEHTPTTALPDSPTDAAELRLARSPLLRSLHILAMEECRGGNYSVEALCRIISLSPKLRSVTFKSYLRDKCVRIVYLEAAVQRHREQGKAFLAFLKEPSFKPKALTEFRWRTDCREFQLNKLFNVVDVSKLVELDVELARCSIQVLESHGYLKGFHALQRLKIHSMRGGKDEHLILGNILRTANPLHSLSLQTVSGFGKFGLILSPCMASHHHSLRSLKMHKREMDERTCARYEPSPIHLSQISTTFPQLETLGIDINREYWEEICENLRGLFHNLKDLHLHFNLALNRPRSERYSPITKKDAKRIWENIHQNRFKKLANLFLNFGKWDGPFVSPEMWLGIDEWRHYEREMRQKVKVTRVWVQDDVVVEGEGVNFSAKREWQTIGELLD